MDIKTVLSELSVSTDAQFSKGGRGIEITHTESGTKVLYAADHMVARAVTLLDENRDICEIPVYKTQGVLLDCSRNAVYTMNTFKDIVRILAKMGYSMIQLYTEDTYTLENYPYFGYMRGAFTHEELREMDDYCAIFGIELTPCIQTLAHLETALRHDTFRDITDFGDIMLIDEEKTYELIEEMFRTMSKCLRSRRINIGMDEAHMVGLGNFLDKHGYHNRIEILMRHLDRIMTIARKYGYRPMMWSDMFFRLANHGEYYNLDNPPDMSVAEKIPADIDIVYWDYYNLDKELVYGMMKRHTALTENVVFAGGAWKWSGFTPSNYFSEATSRVAHECCVKSGVKENIVTAWGDNGGFASTYSILPALLLWAEMCYGESGDIAARFERIAGADYNDFMELSKPVHTPDNPIPGKESVNASLYALWQDPLVGLCDAHIPYDYDKFYTECVTFFDSVVKKGGRFSYLFKTQLDMCRVLELKATLGKRLKDAYDAHDTQALRSLANVVIPEISARLKDFWLSFREQWQKESKPFGLESFDIRIGALEKRLEASTLVITDYLDGKIDSIDELAAPRLAYYESCAGKPFGYNNWAKIVTPSVLS